jgi:hypothetical protein
VGSGEWGVGSGVGWGVDGMNGRGWTTEGGRQGVDDRVSLVRHKRGQRGAKEGKGR